MRFFVEIFLQWAAKRRYPTLLKIVLGCFVIDLLVPDPAPFIDEVVLGVLSIVFAQLKRAPQQTIPAKKQ